MANPGQASAGYVKRGRDYHYSNVLVLVLITAIESLLCALSFIVIG